MTEGAGIADGSKARNAPALLRKHLYPVSQGVALHLRTFDLSRVLPTTEDNHIPHPGWWIEQAVHTSEAQGMTHVHAWIPQPDVHGPFTVEQICDKSVWSHETQSTAAFESEVRGWFRESHRGTVPSDRTMRGMVNFVRATFTGDSIVLRLNLCDEFNRTAWRNSGEYAHTWSHVLVEYREFCIIHPRSHTLTFVMICWD